MIQIDRLYHNYSYEIFLQYYYDSATTLAFTFRRAEPFKNKKSLLMYSDSLITDSIQDYCL